MQGNRQVYPTNNQNQNYTNQQYQQQYNQPYPQQQYQQYQVAPQGQQMGQMGYPQQQYREYQVAPQGQQMVQMVYPQQQYQQVPQNQQMGQQVVYPQQMNGNYQPVFPTRAMMNPQAIMLNPDMLSRLEQLKSVFIMQKFEFFVALCGIYIKNINIKNKDLEPPNTFFVYAGDEQGNMMGEPIMRVKEKSGCCVRYCLPGRYRPYDLHAYNYKGKAQSKQNDQYKDQSNLTFLMQRPFKCTILCCFRPFMDVIYKENNQAVFLGKIVCPFNFFNISVVVYDANNNLKYTIEASCFQCIFWLKLPCESCQKAKFIVSNSAKEPVTELWKESQGCCQACITDRADNFRVLFPQGSSKEDKALLMAAGLFINFMFFEESPADKQDS